MNIVPVSGRGPRRDELRRTAGKNGGVDLDVAADQLYAVAPTNFVLRRNELAAEAQRSGDKVAAAAIKQLRKPTLAAFLANLLVHERNDQIDALFHLGEMLREAQLSKAGPQLRQLAQQRHEAITTLVKEARDLARRAGQPIGEETFRELESTLLAVLSDAEAAAQFRSGRLTSALEYSGFGLFEPVPGRVLSSAKRDLTKEPWGKGSLSGVVGGPPRRRELAEQALRDAQAAVSGATQVLKEQEDELARLEGEREECRVELTALEQELAKAKTAASTLEDQLRRSQRARREAGEALRKARDRATKAEQELGRLPVR